MIIIRLIRKMFWGKSMKTLVQLFALICFAIVSPAVAQQRRGVALVVGNAAYQSSPLRNPVHDAQAVERVLKNVGFETVHAYDATFREMHAAINDTVQRVNPGDPVFIFYAGHGFQSAAEDPADGTDNFLMPVDAALSTPDSVSSQAIGFMQILRRLTTKSPGPIIVIMDACRNNPFLQRWITTRSLVRSTSGLTQPSVFNANGIYVLFATAPGNVASDGGGANGLFTSHLLQYLARPGWSIHQTFEETAAAVSLASSNAQVPWFTGSGAAARFKLRPSDVEVSSTSTMPGDDLPALGPSSISINDTFLAGRSAFERKDYSAAIGSFVEASQRGHSAAAFYLGIITRDGLGTNKDQVAAFKWFDLSARRGNVDAMSSVAIAYYSGLGVPMNGESALYWLVEGAKHGNIHCTYGVGRYFADGKFVQRNYSYAIPYLTKASDAGYGRAMFDIGQLYEQGGGVPQDLTLASRWYERAERSNDARIAAAAKERLGIIWGI